MLIWFCVWKGFQKWSKVVSSWSCQPSIWSLKISNQKYGICGSHKVQRKNMIWKGNRNLKVYKLINPTPNGKKNCLNVKLWNALVGNYCQKQPGDVRKSVNLSWVHFHLTAETGWAHKKRNICIMTPFWKT